MMNYEEATIFMDHLPNKLIELVLNDKIATHDGVFHADDVFASALIALSCDALSENNDESVLDFWVPQRISNDEAKTFDGLLFDVGNEYDVSKLHFDHHQKDCPTYDDGVKMASFGMLSLLFIPKIWGYEVYGNLKNFIKKIDEQDNTGKVAEFNNNIHPISSIIHVMNNTWDEDGVGIYFKDAIKLAYTILKRLIENAQSQRTADSMVEMFYSEIPETNQFKVLVLDQYLPWKTSMMGKEDVIGAIYPSNRGGWNLEAKNTEEFNLPDKWLMNEYKPDGMTFIHQALFLANFETKEQAQAAAESFIACC